MKEKCTVKGCRVQGEPQEGFDFFVCDKCLEEFERLLKVEWAKKNFQISEN